MINQRHIATGEATNKQLAAMGVKPSDLDYVLISHLGSDHANGLNQVKYGKQILYLKPKWRAHATLNCKEKSVSSCEGGREWITRLLIGTETKGPRDIPMIFWTMGG